MCHTTSKRVRGCLLLLSAVLGWGVLFEDAAAAPPLKMSPVDRQGVAALTAAAGPPKAGSIALAGSDKNFFSALSVEFKNAGACKDFKPPEGAWVYHRSGRFANLYVDADKENVL